jgi:hypothetical protein
MNKTITFDRQTRDFRAEVDGILIGFYATHTEAQVACDNYVFEALARS